jgi:hypothetical protein
MAFVIAGYGQFGKLAASRLKDLYPRESFKLVDRDATKFAESVIPSNSRAIIAEAEEFVTDLIESRHEGQWIIPTVPFHLLARVALRRFPELEEAVLVEELSSLVPNPYRVDRATLWCSYADFLCPDDCEEGPECSVTGESRKPLSAVLGNLFFHGKAPKILVSRQLCPGIGGYRSTDLLEFLDDLVGFYGVIGTSCKCHAVLTALRWRSKI